jgi:polyhydroxybutyrate depolymerase
MRRRSLLTTVAIATVAIACQSSKQSGQDASSGSDGDGGSSAGSGAGGDSPHGSNAGTASPATDVTSEILVVDGTPRRFVQAVPHDAAPGAGLVLVLVLHGDGADGTAMRTSMPFDQVSGHAAVVAYPSGQDYTWDLFRPTDENADMRFLLALVDVLRSKYSVDSGHIFATGFSSGAFMINQLACRQPGLVAAIAPQSGGSPDEPIDPSAGHFDNGYTRCAAQTRGSGPATMIIHGTDDTTVPYGSGIFEANYWAYVNGCATTDQTAQTDCVSYDGCPAKQPVVFCSVPKLGHQIWSDATTTIWTFFSGL